MELVNSGISNALGNSSWIRRMFEAGLESEARGLMARYKKDDPDSIARIRNENRLVEKGE